MKKCTAEADLNAFFERHSDFATGWTNWQRRNEVNPDWTRTRKVLLPQIITYNMINQGAFPADVETVDIEGQVYVTDTIRDSRVLITEKRRALNPPRFTRQTDRVIRIGTDVNDPRSKVARSGNWQVYDKAGFVGRDSFLMVPRDIFAGKTSVLQDEVEGYNLMHSEERGGALNWKLQLLSNIVSTEPVA